MVPVSLRTGGGEYVIEINKDLEAAESWYSCLAHELAHVYCGHLGDDEDKRWKARTHLSRNQREIEAESIAYLVCTRQGLMTKAMEYVAGYLQNQEKDLASVNMSTMLNVAGTIEAMGTHFYPERTAKEITKPQAGENEKESDQRKR
jgi:antirestriction protein ArdC